jgi:hypothetical protein
MKPSLLSLKATPYRYGQSHVPFPLRQLLEVMQYHARDTDAEIYLGETLVLRSLYRMSWHWRMGLTLSSACTLLCIAFVFVCSRQGGAGLSEMFLLAIAFIFVLPAWRLLAPVLPRGERIYLLCLVGMTCYLVKVLGFPLHFTYYDEFLHWRTADDILTTHHLFQRNALLPVSSYYPGLEIITNALSSVSGLDTFSAGMLVIGVARLVLILALFLLNERMLKSSRAGSLAVLLYMANPHFLLFDAQYSYESLALSFVVLLLVLMEPHQALALRMKHLPPFPARVLFVKAQRGILRSNQRMIIVSTGLMIVALVFTHHATDFFFNIFLVVWTIIYIAMRLPASRQAYLIQITLFAVCLSLFSIIRDGNPVVTYLFRFIGNAFQELGNISHGSGTARQLFVNYTGQQAPLWERIFAISSVLLIMCSMPFGLLSILRRHHLNALAVVCCLLALCYPLSQIFRFTRTGSDLTDRLAAFLFIPIAMVLATCITQFFPVFTFSMPRRLFLTGAMTFVFLGGIILSAGPNFALLPGPYQAIADARSLEPEGIQAAQWAATNLQDGGLIATDRIDQILMGTYGDQQIATSIAEKIDLSPIFLSPQIGPHEIALLRRARVHYLVVDLRLSQALPLLGFYYEQSEENAFHHITPISVVALSKFHHLPSVGRIFDSGNIIIYDVESLSSSRTPS